MRLAVVLSGLALVIGGCGADETATDAGPLIVATTSIWGDVVGHVACDGLATIEVLIAAGSDPHEYEPSLADRQTLADADLIVTNGLDLEESLLDTLDSAVSDGVAQFVIGDHIPNLLDGGHGDAGDPDDDDHAGSDPHVWQDPTRAAASLDALGEALVTEAGLDEDAVTACRDAYTVELTEVDQTVRDTLSVIPTADRELVTNHDALAYFADRYDLTVIGTVIPSASTLSSASPAELEGLVHLIEETGTKAVFAETQHGSDDADALASEVGVPVVTLYTDSLGEAGSGADTYTGLLLTNARLIADALSG